MQIAVNVVVIASLYCLICCGYVLVYPSSRVLNLAHGEIMTLGGVFPPVRCDGRSPPPSLLNKSGACIQSSVGFGEVYSSSCDS